MYDNSISILISLMSDMQLSPGNKGVIPLDAGSTPRFVVDVEARTIVGSIDLDLAALLSSPSLSFDKTYVVTPSQLDLASGSYHLQLSLVYEDGIKLNRPAALRPVPTELPSIDAVLKEAAEKGTSNAFAKETIQKLANNETVWKKTGQLREWMCDNHGLQDVDIAAIVVAMKSANFWKDVATNELSIFLGRNSITAVGLRILLSAFEDKECKVKVTRIILDYNPLGTFAFFWAD